MVLCYKSWIMDIEHNCGVLETAWKYKGPVYNKKLHANGSMHRLTKVELIGIIIIPIMNNYYLLVAVTVKMSGISDQYVILLHLKNNNKKSLETVVYAHLKGMRGKMQ